MDNKKNYTKIALEATDLDYLDKAGLSRKLGTFTINNFWEEVMDYRKDFKRSLPIKLLNGYCLTLTATQTLLGKWANIDESLKKVINSLGTELSEKARKEARKSLYLPALKAMKELERVEMSELSLKAMINGTYAESNPNHQILLGYLNCLDSYSEKTPIIPDENFLAEALMKLRDEPELTSFYREGNDFDRRRSTFFSFGQDKAPDGHVEDFMEPFVEFITNNSYPTFVSLAAILFYMPLVSPFSNANIAMTSLLAKECLAYKFGKEAFYLPIERLLLSDSLFSSASKNVRSSGDLTFLVCYWEKTIEKLLIETKETINNAKIAVYSPEYNQLSEEEKKAVSKAALSEPIPPKNEQLTLDSFLEEKKPNLESKEEEGSAIESSFEPKIQKHEEELPKEAEETQEDIEKTLSNFKEESLIEETPNKEREPETEEIRSLPSEEIEPLGDRKTEEKAEETSPKKETIAKPLVPASKTITEKEMVEASRNVSAPSFELDVLSEKEAKEYMRYLLETNPNLNKKQASFLSTHCTPGRFYSIQQFKTFTHCVYETARTSMDKLALEGYYEKLQVKNKFVYTPKRKGDSK